jgi:putative transposase
MARRLAGELRADHPDSAASLLEGLEDMFTVRRLGVAGRLALTLTNTNCIESMIGVARDAMGRVKRWKDGSMKKRWVAAGVLEAERSFRRVKGCAEMPTLVAAIRREVARRTAVNIAETVTPPNYDQAVA